MANLGAMAPGPPLDPVSKGHAALPQHSNTPHESIVWARVRGHAALPAPNNTVDSHWSGVRVAYPLLLIPVTNNGGPDDHRHARNHLGGNLLVMDQGHQEHGKGRGEVA